MTDEALERDEDAEGEAPVFADLEEFVAEYFTKIVERRLDGNYHTWCPAWWKHAEAISRLGALWSAWEFLRLDPALGMSTWWLHHADPHLSVLLDADNGPFSACSPTDGHSDLPPRSLPTAPAPAGMWNGSAFTVRPRDERPHTNGGPL